MRIISNHAAEDQNPRVTRSSTDGSQHSTSDHKIPTADFVKSDPIGALILCKEAWISFQKTTKEVDIELCQACFVAMDEFCRDDLKWKNFVKHINESKLVKRKINPKKSSDYRNTIVAQFVFGFRKSRDRAYKIARVLDFVRLRTNDPEVLRSRIEKAGGIESLYKEAVETLPYLGKDRETKQKMRSAYATKDHKTLAALVGKGSTISDELDSGESGEPDEGEPSDMETSATTSPVIEEFSIEVTEKQFTKLISMGRGDKRHLTIECIGELGDGWKRFKLIETEPVELASIDDEIPF
ncbi:hypothetical protein FJ417_00140 [Mesorhizobium sp. B3-1-7]|uniref:hypothetical protein n=1 Tax=Mesorhizobium sp. B3-1-7 TaxID=2589894 RepID=UPI001125C9FE|nr:hypothetical protein [Mesorhizobium sp. B3-1-7]TPI65031.1 hypothetical protein FJ417_00140 [Mesorhizobium sp. B3-1-7]